MKHLLALILAALACAAQTPFFSPLLTVPGGETLIIGVNDPFDASVYIGGVDIKIAQDLQASDVGACQFFVSNWGNAPYLWMYTGNGWDARPFGQVSTMTNGLCTVSVGQSTFAIDPSDRRRMVVALAVTYGLGGPRNVFAWSSTAATWRSYFARLRPACTTTETADPFDFWCGSPR